MRLFILFFICSSLAHSQELLSAEPVFRKLGDTTSLSLMAAGVLSTLVTQPNDDRIRDEWKYNQQMSKSMSNLGNFLGSGIAGVMIVGGQYLIDTKEENWKTHARGLIWETAAVFAMKYSFGRQRPGNSDSYQSFPSGHTATAFATATSLTYSYGWKAAALAYPIAVFVGASRWSDDAHWGSDVVAGAFVGIIMARASVLDDSPEIGQKNQASLTPIISPDFAGLNYLYSF